MYIVYGGRFTRTICVQMVLEEGGIPYELRELDILRDEHRSAQFLAINPAGYIPAMITPEGQALHETAAIMLYLADRHGLRDLAPGVRKAGLRARSVSRWCSRKAACLTNSASSTSCAASTDRPSFSRSIPPAMSRR